MNSHLETPLYKFAPASELGPAEDYPAGSLEWAERISNRLQIGAGSVNQHTVYHLLNTIKAIWTIVPHPWEIWPADHPFGTPDDYCVCVTGHSWEFLVKVVAEFAHDPTMSIEGMRADLAKAQAKYRKQGKHIDHRHNVPMKGGNASEKILRRLARDHPDVLAGYERGEFKSVRAAAIAAGFRKQLTPLERVCKLLSKLTSAEMRQLREHIDQVICVDGGSPQ